MLLVAEAVVLLAVGEIFDSTNDEFAHIARRKPLDSPDLSPSLGTIMVVEVFVSSPLAFFSKRKRNSMKELLVGQILRNDCPVELSNLARRRSLIILCQTIG